MLVSLPHGQITVSCPAPDLYRKGSGFRSDDHPDICNYQERVTLCKQSHSKHIDRDRGYVELVA